MQISIMQDPVETKHAKNTARLIPLLVPQTEIFIGQHPEDFSKLINKIANYPNTLLLYPCSEAVSLSSNKHLRSPVEHILMLDGTWRKAKKLYLNNPWLTSLNTATLDEHGLSNYTIRQRPFENSFSTIEALALTLNILEHCPTKPFMDALTALQQHWPKQ